MEYVYASEMLVFACVFKQSCNFFLLNFSHELHEVKDIAFTLPEVELGPSFDVVEHGNRSTSDFFRSWIRQT